ncbi:MAG: histidine kinase dimerization/phospho-acceptor domain-containing protein [Rhodospirillaceae bacterium]
MNMQPVTFDGKRAGIVWHIDISARKNAKSQTAQARVEAERAKMAKSQFLASMSHDLCTPINAILGFSDIIYHQSFGSVGNSKYLEYAGNICESGELLLDMVNDVLDLSKIEAGKARINETELSIAETLKCSLRQVTPLAER